MNTNDLIRILNGAKIVGEHFIRVNGPHAAEKTHRAIYHAGEFLKSIAQMTTSASSSTELEVENRVPKKETSIPTDPFGFSSKAIAMDKEIFSEVISTKATQQMRERSVPSSQMQRVIGFGSLAASMGIGALSENVTNFFSNNKPSQGISDANAERLAEALCRLRGAALKLGQMLSIQDSEGLLPESLAKALERVRQSADYMPEAQLQEQLSMQLGETWKDRFLSFETIPLAAASIGQVHRARLLDGTDVVVKVQYPGVAMSISSDLNNLKLLVTATNLLPPGLYVDEIIRVARSELLEECNYTLELSHQIKYREFIESDQLLR